MRLASSFCCTYIGSVSKNVRVVFHVIKRTNTFAPKMLQIIFRTELYLLAMKLVFGCFTLVNLFPCKIFPIFMAKCFATLFTLRLMLGNGTLDRLKIVFLLNANRMREKKKNFSAGKSTHRKDRRVRTNWTQQNIKCDVYREKKRAPISTSTIQIEEAPSFFTCTWE